MSDLIPNEAVEAAKWTYIYRASRELGVPGEDVERFTDHILTAAAPIIAAQATAELRARLGALRDDMREDASNYGIIGRELVTEEALNTWADDLGEILGDAR